MAAGGSASSPSSDASSSKTEGQTNAVADYLQLWAGLGEIILGTVLDRFIKGKDGTLMIRPPHGTQRGITAVYFWNLILTCDFPPFDFGQSGSQFECGQ